MAWETFVLLSEAGQEQPNSQETDLFGFRFNSEKLNKQTNT